MKVLELANQEGIKCTFIHSKLLVELGTLFTRQGKPFVVSVPRVTPSGIGLERTETWRIGGDT